MELVIADTGPVNYLLLIQQIDLLQQLFFKVYLSNTVRNELAASNAPRAVREWIANPPGWIELRDVNIRQWEDESIGSLDDGEKFAILLATLIKGHLLLMDDRRGVKAARTKGFGVIGSIGLLDLAAHRKMIDLPDAIERLRRTNFRRSEAMLDELIRKHSQ